MAFSSAPATALAPALTLRPWPSLGPIASALALAPALALAMAWALAKPGKRPGREEAREVTLREAYIAQLYRTPQNLTQPNRAP